MFEIAHEWKVEHLLFDPRPQKQNISWRMNQLEKGPFGFNQLPGYDETKADIV